MSANKPGSVAAQTSSSIAAAAVVPSVTQHLRVFAAAVAISTGLVWCWQTGLLSLLGPSPFLLVLPFGPARNPKSVGTALSAGPFYAFCVWTGTVLGEFGLAFDSAYRRLGAVMDPGLTLYAAREGPIWIFLVGLWVWGMSALLVLNLGDSDANIVKHALHAQTVAAIHCSAAWLFPVFVSSPFLVFIASVLAAASLSVACIKCDV